MPGLAPHPSTPTQTPTQPVNRQPLTSAPPDIHTRHCTPLHCTLQATPEYRLHLTHPTRPLRFRAPCQSFTSTSSWCCCCLLPLLYSTLLSSTYLSPRHAIPRRRYTYLVLRRSKPRDFCSSSPRPCAALCPMLRDSSSASDPLSPSRSLHFSFGTCRDAAAPRLLLLRHSRASRPFAHPQPDLRAGSSGTSPLNSRG